MLWYWLCVRYCKRSYEDKVDRTRSVTGLEASATQVSGSSLRYLLLLAHSSLLFPSRT